MNKKKKSFNRPVTLALTTVMALGVLAPFSSISSFAIDNVQKEIQQFHAGDVIQFAGENYVVINPATGYVMKQTYVTSRAYSNTEANFLFNSSETGNIGYYLNNDFYNSLPADAKSQIQTSNWEIYDKYGERVYTSVSARIGLPSLLDAQNNSVVANALQNAWSMTTFIDTNRNIQRPLALNGASYEHYSPLYVANVHPAFHLIPTTLVTLVEASPEPIESPVASNSGSGQVTKVIGTFEATTLDVVIPAISSFLYNPNLNRIDAQPFTIYNQTNAPVYATMKEISISPDSTWNPSLVSPDKYTAEQWNNLTKAQTQAEVALGLVANEGTNWLQGILKNNLWSTEIGQGIKIGVIKTDSPVVVKPTVQSGTALNLEGVITANYVFEFGLE